MAKISLLEQENQHLKDQLFDLRQSLEAVELSNDRGLSTSFSDSTALGLRSQPSDVPNNSCRRAVSITEGPSHQISTASGNAGSAN